MTSTNTNVVAKIAAVVAGLGLVAMSFASFAPAKAQTNAEMQAQITQLLATIASLQAQMGGSANTSTAQLFTSDLTLGSSGPEVTSLQGWLISKGFAIPAGATGYFGAQTQSALAAYQASVAISPAAGYFGPITRAKVNAELGAGGNTGTGPIPGNTGGLSGGAGSVDSYDLVSGLDDEEVGEDEEDVEVAGLEIEVDDGSDLEFTAVRLVFVQTDDNSGDASEDFEDVASEVSIWLDGEEVARVDAEDFNDDNNYTGTVSLDDAVIEAGDTAELTVAVSGISNLDSDDEESAWSVEFRQVRFEDADGATISEDPDQDVTEFSFVSFASATDAELNISLTNSDDADDINDGHVVAVDSSDDTENIEILAFTMEAEGDSDLSIDEIPVLFTVTSSAAELSDIVSNVRLFMDGEEIGSESVNSGLGATTTASATIVFEDLDFTLEAGEEAEFVVEVDVNNTGGEFVSGDSVEAVIGQTEREAIDVEDESGEDLDNGDITGTANGDPVGLVTAGIMAEFVSAEEDVTSPETGADRGTFKITFDVTALEADAYVDATAIANAVGGATYQDIAVASTAAPSSITGVISSNADFNSADGGTYLVEEGDTERFVVTVTVTPSADGFVSVSLTSILYSLDDEDGDTLYTYDMGDYKTDAVYLDTNA